MARILICEPHAEVRELLRLVVTRLGHVPVLPEESDSKADLDLVVLEPVHVPSLELVSDIVSFDAGLPIVCTSIHPPDRPLGLEPFAYLLKPFALPDLEDAIQRALAVPRLTAA